MKIKDTNKTNSVASKSSLKQNLVLPELTKEEEKQEYQEKLSGEIRVALIGNPNCGQTTLFNAITGTHQYVGNWPGVTVEKKEGHYKRDKRIKFVDLPGVYSLSAHVNDELLAREFLLSKECGIILNVIDATNLERGLYLTQQLCELGKPIIIALNMMDVVTKRGYLINQEKLAQKLAVDVVKVSGQQEQGIESLIDTIKKVSTKKKKTQLAKFSHKTENYLAQIERLLPSNVPTELIRYFSIKAFENDPALPNQIKEIEEIRIVSNAAKSEFGEENSETITNERYMYITSFIGSVHKHAKSSASVSEKIDRILLNRIFAIPIFIIIMAIVYFIAVSSIGSAATQWVSSGLFGDGFFLGPYDPQFDIDMQNNLSQSNNALKPNPSDYGLFILGIPVILENALNAIQCAEWLQSLVLNGIVAGVGAVLSFIPQIFLLFFMLAILENCGYLARVAFILDKIFRRFGLNGKSFIPMLIGTGCGVPAILATRTIENESSRRLTIMTTTFMPCSAKLPIIALISGSLFGGNPIIAPSCYFIGISAIILSSVILKHTKPFLLHQPSSII
ncbi:MAG: ferrous iron transporter B [Coriobacteriales bacterium]|nr:ferrous iron transporter B [Coriobacteriales bacterium]